MADTPDLSRLFRRAAERRATVSLRYGEAPYRVAVLSCDGGWVTAHDARRGLLRFRLERITDAEIHASSDPLF